MSAELELPWLAMPPLGFLEQAAGVADLDAIAAIEAGAFPTPWRRDYFAQELDQPQRFNRVMRRVVGSALRPETVAYFFCSYIFDEMHVNKIAVDTRFRDRGLGGFLLDRGLSFAASRGIRLLTLEVRTDNPGAIAFYRRRGFDDAYVRKGYYQDGMDALVMQLLLGRRDAP